MQQRSNIHQIIGRQTDKIGIHPCEPAMFDAIPSQLSKNASRYTISTVIPGEKQDRIIDIVQLMGTNVLDKIPFLHLPQPSQISFTGEFAQLIAGEAGGTQDNASYIVANLL